MPGGDGTGPMGLGPMTGRGSGYCVMSNKKNNGTYGYAGIAGKPIFNYSSFFNFNNIRFPVPAFVNPYYWPYIKDPYSAIYPYRRYNKYSNNV